MNLETQKLSWTANALGFRERLFLCLFHCLFRAKICLLENTSGKSCFPLFIQWEDMFSLYQLDFFFCQKEEHLSSRLGFVSVCSATALAQQGYIRRLFSRGAWCWTRAMGNEFFYRPLVLFWKLKGGDLQKKHMCMNVSSCPSILCLCAFKSLCFWVDSTVSAAQGPH